MTSAKEIRSPIYKKFIKFFLKKFGYEIKRVNNFMDRYEFFIAEATKDEIRELNFLSDKSLTTIANLWSISKSLEHIYNNHIGGDIVECGVYNGFTLAFIGKLMNKFNLNSKLWGYDTYGDGFILKNYTENDLNPKNKKQNFTESKENYPKIENVVKNINIIDRYDENKYKLIKGDIINTLENKLNIPEKISFLRMDTDIYLTTKKQLEILYPKLSIGGILHIDDYGLCPGVRKAVDEYFFGKKIWLHRVDLSCRYLIKS